MIKKNKNINFFSIEKNIPENYYPKPAYTCLPDWYKDQESYILGNKKVNEGVVNQSSIKRCIPVFDSLTSGYFIFSSVDIYVSQKDNAPYFNWALNILEEDAISFHPGQQFSKHPEFKDLPSLPKFFNPWVIETPKGYSVFITPPKHRNLPFEIIPGIVDTDSYNATIHFPFYLKDLKWEGLIPAGTPIAQVVPFKRDQWKMSLVSKKRIEKTDKISFLLRSNYFNGYKKFFWTKKFFK